MIKPDKWPADHQQWDKYKAFHVGVTRSGFCRLSSYHPPPLVLFETGELILTERQPDPNGRGEYRIVGVELLKEDELGGYWTPTGMQLKKAWMQTGQRALVDQSSGRAVRTDGVLHTRDRNVIRPNVPERFRNVQAYIGGPGCHPVGTDNFEIRPTIRDMPQAMQDHVKRIEQTFRAAMVLAEHAVTRDDTIVRQPLSFEKVMKAPAWESMPYNDWLMLWRNGVDRPKLTPDHLLISAPR